MRDDIPSWCALVPGSQGLLEFWSFPDRLATLTLCTAVKEVLIMIDLC
jgi:hypothetical protein